MLGVITAIVLILLAILLLNLKQVEPKTVNQPVVISELARETPTVREREKDTGGKANGEEDVNLILKC